MILDRDIVKKSFWALNVGEVLDLWETTSDGLSDEEAARRLRIFGRNEIAEAQKLTRVAILLNQLQNPLILILLIAATITVLLKDYQDTAVIMAAVIVNSLLGFYQEYKAEESLSDLKSYIEERVRVIREEREMEINTKELVPGDIIHIAQGDRIPADARIIYNNSLIVDESILTGEALPVEKQVEPVGFHAALGDQKSLAFSGTLVVQGFANAVVCRTGYDSEIGRIAALVKNQTREETPLQKAIRRFSLRAGLVFLLLISLVFAAGVMTGYSILEMFLISVAMLVSAIPEGLPIAMTVILAVGVQRLAKKNGVVRKLMAIETLGNTNIILTDKTGTLTEAKLELSRITVFHNEGTNDELVLKLALLNSDVVIENPKDKPAHWRIIGRPLEAAVARAAANLGISPKQTKKEIPVLDYLPFNSSNKFSASLVEYQGENLICFFGAPEILLKMSTAVPVEDRQEITRVIDKMAYGGERVVGVATKKITEPIKLASLNKNKIDGAIFLGTISFIDPLRPGVRDTIHRIDHIGIRTVIVTGDHRGTAENVAKELGLTVSPEHVINGSELDAMSAEEITSRLPKLHVISRVSPEGKLKIAKAFQDAGNIVAMTGDGINDAPSLKQADIGVAMGSGTDVAKDVSDLVLLDNNYHTIVSAIEEGRRTMENVRKVLVYLLVSVLDELILIGGALFSGLPLPLNPIQILWVNFLTDSFPAISLAFEDHIDYLLQKPRPPQKSLMDKEMKILIFGIGIPTSLILFFLYQGLLGWGVDPELIRSFIFASFGTYSLFLIFSVRSLQKSLIRYNLFSNFYLLLGVGLGMICMLAAIYFPPLQALLRTTALPPIWMAGVVGVGLFNVAAIEFGKWLYRR